MKTRIKHVKEYLGGDLTKEYYLAQYKTLFWWETLVGSHTEDYYITNIETAKQRIDNYLEDIHERKALGREKRQNIETIIRYP